MKNKKLLFYILVVILIIVSVFFSLKSFFLTDQSKSSLSAWVVYWDLENTMDELNYLKNNLDTVSLFSSYYDYENNLIIPKSLKENVPDIQEFCNDNKIEYYITIVNDKIYKNGESSLKDKNLLNDILSNKKNRDNAIDDIVNLAKEGGYDGIEIDYEGIKKDYELWENFLIFSKDLYEKALAHELKLRIILEPSAPIDNIELLKGPEYIMMAYNLHGPNDDPGAKADKTFIRELAKKMKNIKSEKTMAFSTGGFNWVANGKTKAVTETQAKKLMIDYNVMADRDNDSGCLTFKYNDNQGREHIVWFADGTTLKSWINVAEEEGIFNFALWRLGGNSKETLENKFSD